MLALEDIDNTQPGIRLFGVGREEERQCIVVRTTRRRPRRHRRSAKRAGAA
jgi:hypothetical protein